MGVPCGGGDGSYPVEVVVGGTLWRWWWEVPCGGGGGRYLEEVVMHGRYPVKVVMGGTCGGGDGRYLWRW